MDLQHLQKHRKKYLAIYFALLLCTVITVAISYLHMSVVPAIVLALTVASVKGGLVAYYFMHLSDEKSIIYKALILTAVLLIPLLMLPILTSSNKIVPPGHSDDHALRYDYVP